MDLERIVVRIMAEDKSYQKTMDSVEKRMLNLSRVGREAGQTFQKSFESNFFNPSFIQKMGDRVRGFFSNLFSGVFNSDGYIRTLIAKGVNPDRSVVFGSRWNLPGSSMPNFIRALQRVEARNFAGAQLNPDTHDVTRLAGKWFGAAVNTDPFSRGRFLSRFSNMNLFGTRDFDQASTGLFNWGGLLRPGSTSLTRAVAGARLGHGIPGLTGSMSDLDRRFSGLRKLTKSSDGGGGSGMGLGSLGLGGSAKSLGSAAGGLLSALTSPTALIGMATFGFSMERIATNVVKSAAKFEQLSIAMEVMAGSKVAGNSILKQIIDLAVETPFRSSELVAGAKQLKGFGFGNEDILPSLKVLGDVSAGTGTSLDRIILAFGQVRSAGRLMGTELRQFVNAGIPMIDFLARVMNEPTENIKKLVEAGSVSYEHVKRAFNLMVGQGGPYFMLMDRLSKTTAGRWEALTENLEVFGREVGLSFFRGFGTAELLDSFSKMTRELAKSSGWLDQWFLKLRKIFDIAASVGETLGKWVFNQGKGFFSDLGNISWENFETSALNIATTLLSAFEEMVANAKEIAAVMLKGFVLPMMQVVRLIAGISGDNALVKAVQFAFKNSTFFGRNSEIIQAISGMGPSGKTEAEKTMEAIAGRMEEDARKYRSGQRSDLADSFTSIVARRQMEMRRRFAEAPQKFINSVVGNDPVSQFIATGQVPAGAAQIRQIDPLPSLFGKDRSKFPSGMIGSEFNTFQNSLKEIEDARRFLLKKEVGIGGIAGGLGIGGTQWAFEKMAGAEFLDAFEKLEKSVTINSKQQNAGAAAMKGSQEAIAIIARSEGSGRKEDRVAKVMEAIDQKMKDEVANTKEMKEALKEYLRNNPGIVSREP